jgi:hypothetical protein
LGSGIISQTLEHDIKILLRVVGQHADRGEGERTYCDRSNQPFLVHSCLFLLAFALDKLFFRFTLSSFSYMTFGRTDVGALETGEPVPFAEAFDEAQSIMDARFTK